MTPSPQHLVIQRLIRPERWWREKIHGMPSTTGGKLFDLYYDLAEANRQSGGQCYENLFAFAYRLNDLVVEHNHTQRHPKKLRVPAYAATLRQARRRGLVPQPADGAHVEIGFAFNYQTAARSAFIVVKRDEDNPYEMDFRWLAGLDVRLMATAADWHVIDPLARVLAYHGARNITLRRLDRKCDDEVLYLGDRPWRL